MNEARYANCNDVPLAMGVWLATDTYDHDPRPNVISATSLMKPLRQIILPPRIPQGLALPKLADQIRTQIGRAVHDAIETAWRDNYVQAMRDIGYPEHLIQRVRINPDQGTMHNDPDMIPVFIEQRAEKKVGKWIVTGKYDIICDGRVQDYKTATIWSYMNQVNKDKQSQQGSLYRWLNPNLVYDDEIDIHHIFLDWSAAKAVATPNYPRRAFIDQTIPLMSIQETDQWVRRKLALVDKYWDADEADIPECNDDELWRSDPVFKYYGKSENTRASKVFTDKQEAMIYFAEKGKGELREVPGEVTACKYCNAFQGCTQKDALIASGHLTFTR